LITRYGGGGRYETPLLIAEAVVEEGVGSGVLAALDGAGLSAERLAGT